MRERARARAVPAMINYRRARRARGFDRFLSATEETNDGDDDDDADASATQHDLALYLSLYLSFSLLSCFLSPLLSLLSSNGNI